jgi:hypothetical protein
LFSFFFGTRKNPVGLVCVYSIGAVGTAVTGLRLWKNISTWHIDGVGGAHLEYNRRLAVELAQFILLSYIKVGVIATCGNLPTLTGLWRSMWGTRSAARRTATGTGTTGTRSAGA